MRHYEVMIIMNPSLDERNVPQRVDGFLKVVRDRDGSVENVDVWGKRRLAYEIDKNTEGIYAVASVNCTPEVVGELERQLGLNENVLRTKVLRREPNEAARRGAA